MTEFKKWFAARARNPDKITLEEAFDAGASAQQRAQPAPSVPEGSAVQTAARILNIDLIRQRDELRAKVEQMERQEPAGYGVRYVEPTNGEEDWDSIWMHRVFAEDHIKDFTQAYVDIGEPVGAITVVPLYALPGAQPAPSVPEGWKLVPVEPTQEMINHVIKERLEALVAWKEHTFIDIYKAMLAAAAPEAKP